MLLRGALYMLLISITWNIVEYVFTRNLMAGLYPPEADSISIPIITNQVLLVAIGVLLLPICILGSTWVIERMKALARTIQVICIVVILGFYALSGLVFFSMTVGSLDHPHIEVGLCYGSMFLLLTILFFIDVRKICQEIYKR